MRMRARTYIARVDNPWSPLCDRNVADEDAIMSVEEGGVEVRENAVPGQQGRIRNRS